MNNINDINPIFKMLNLTIFLKGGVRRIPHSRRQNTYSHANTREDDHFTIEESQKSRKEVSN